MTMAWSAVRTAAPRRGAAPALRTLGQAGARAPHLRVSAAAMSTSSPLKALNLSNINQNLVKAHYAVRGEIASKSEQYRQQLAGANPLPSRGSDLWPPLPAPEQETAKLDKGHDLPFDSVISANIGNPQQLDQKPITFFRQVLSILEYPALLAHNELFPEDVMARATKLLADVGSVGAYSQSMGALGVRKSVARFIEERDGFPADPSNIFLTAGASAGVHNLLNTLCTGPKSGVLIPIPQYPLYTASLALLNATAVPYYLVEEHHWNTEVPSIKQAMDTARKNGTDVRAIVVINPGNPTGASLPEHDIEEIIKLAAAEKLVIMADEVYQTNVYRGEFHSFKKSLRKLQKESPDKYDHVELVSLHSTSKGMVGECGHRGGYFELVGIDKEVQDQIYKLVSITLCPPVIGQCLVELMVNPPKQGEPSYELYNKEYSAIYEGLKSRAKALHSAFQGMTGMSCQDPQGAMYLFPTIDLPAKAIAKAKQEGKQADEYYCMRLLDATGICVVAGSGFGQKEGQWHFRTTFLPPGTEWVGRWRDFHEAFMKEFS